VEFGFLQLLLLFTPEIPICGKKIHSSMFAFSLFYLSRPENLFADKGQRDLKFYYAKENSENSQFSAKFYLNYIDLNC